ncbi:hypothetical protein LTR66_015030 [Elasticomyces elasticus]|nr:hypothetical protein LTR66_015030 [Elasticomyces elasticus]KAK4978522.1 hypothetical protein LTR28_005182 [Elasticomyces elasticus]
MAAPPELSMQDLTGSCFQNKTLSDSFDRAFAIQGIPWIIRKVVSIATLSLKVAHEVDESGAKTLVFTQAASVAIAGLSEEKEVRFLDGRETLHSSTLFGTSSARSRLVNMSTATGNDGKPLDPLLTRNFLQEGESGGDNNLFDLVVHQTKGWVMEQIWGFGIVNDERRLIKKMVIRKGDDVAHATAFYDWKGREEGQ